MKAKNTSSNLTVSGSSSAEKIRGLFENESKNIADSTLSQRIQTSFNRVFNKGGGGKESPGGGSDKSNEDDKATILFDLKAFKAQVQKADKTSTSLELEFDKAAPKTGPELSQIIDQDLDKEENENENENKEVDEEEDSEQINSLEEGFEEEIDNTPNAEVREWRAGETSLANANNTKNTKNKIAIEDVGIEMPAVSMDMELEGREKKKDETFGSQEEISLDDSGLNSNMSSEVSDNATFDLDEGLEFEEDVVTESEDLQIKVLGDEVDTPSPADAMRSVNIDLEPDIFGKAQDNDAVITEREDGQTTQIPRIVQDQENQRAPLFTPSGVQSTSNSENWNHGIIQDDVDQLRRSSKDVQAFYSDELLRLQVVVRQLRENREQLLQQVKDLEEKRRFLDQEYLGLKALNEDLKIELSLLTKRHNDEVEALRYRIKMTDEKKNILEEKSKQMQKEMEHFHQHIRLDVSQVRQREKELEHQLELLKSDTGIQIATRDNKILELKKKIDMLEFDIEGGRMKDREVKTQSVVLEEKIHRVMKALRMTLGMLEEDPIVEEKRKKVDKPIKI